MTRELVVPVRDAVPHDVPRVHALNQANLPEVGATTLEQMRWYLDEASWFRVVELDGEIVAYLVAMTPEVPYESGNFLWFRERGRDFVYIDRVAVAETHRGRGIGRALYRDVEDFAREVGARRLTCEVNVRPRNEGSLRFHDALGFQGLEERETDYGPRVLMMEHLL